MNYRIPPQNQLEIAFWPDEDCQVIEIRYVQLGAVTGHVWMLRQFVPYPEWEAVPFWRTLGVLIRKFITEKGGL